MDCPRETPRAEPAAGGSIRERVTCAPGRHSPASRPGAVLDHRADHSDLANLAGPNFPQYCREILTSSGLGGRSSPGGSTSSRIRLIAEEVVPQCGGDLAHPVARRPAGQQYEALVGPRPGEHEDQVGRTAAGHPLRSGVLRASALASFVMSDRRRSSERRWMAPAGSGDIASKTGSIGATRAWMVAIPATPGASNRRSMLAGLPPELVECDVQACPGLLATDAVNVNPAHLLELPARSLCLRAELAIDV